MLEQNLGQIVLVAGLVSTLALLFFRYLGIRDELAYYHVQAARLELMLEVCRNRNTQLAQQIEDLAGDPTPQADNPPVSIQPEDEPDLPF